MEEKVKFVWEVTKSVSTYVARKKKRYEDMKELYENIRSAIREGDRNSPVVPRKPV